MIQVIILVSHIWNVYMHAYRKIVAVPTMWLIISFLFSVLIVIVQLEKLFQVTLRRCQTKPLCRWLFMRIVNPAPVRAPWTSHCSTSPHILTVSWPTWTQWGSSACSQMSLCGLGTAPSHATGKDMVTSSLKVLPLLPKVSVEAKPKNLPQHRINNQTPLWYRLKYLNNYFIDCHNIWFGHLCPTQNEL